VIVSESLLTTFEQSESFFDPTGAVAKIILSQNQTTITKYNQVMLVQIHETLCHPDFN
jgi:hypothetical protein